MAATTFHSSPVLGISMASRFCCTGFVAGALLESRPTGWLNPQGAALELPWKATVSLSATKARAAEGQDVM